MREERQLGQGHTLQRSQEHRTGKAMGFEGECREALWMGEIFIFIFFLICKSLIISATIFNVRRNKYHLNEDKTPAERNASAAWKWQGWGKGQGSKEERSKLACSKATAIILPTGS